jgi:hypothetical protein
MNENSPLSDRSEQLFQIMKSARFLNKEGLGNEVPFFICPYRPQEEVEMKRVMLQLIRRLQQHGLQILHVNLYDLSIELLQKRGIWDRILTKEPSVSKEELKELLQGVLDPEKHLIPAVAEKMSHSEFDILILSGAGEVFPYIRSHNVLNNLQSTAKDKPTVLFFPGTYTHSLEAGASLDLFGRLHDDKYYRAFNIYHFEV